ncbi:MAG: hypothetical protein V4655_03975 [Bdellovibrionota bacterium]
MTKTSLRSKVSLLFLTLLLGSMACTKKGRSPSLDSERSGGACDQLNIARDAAWTSSFVKGFVSCLSEGSETSRQKFALSLDVLNRLGDQSLQSTLDLFQFRSGGLDVFFGLTSSLLDRGAADQSPARWPATQAVLEDTRPFAFAQLLMELKRRDLLTPLLDTLQSADDTLPKGFVETGIRQFLNDDRVKADTILLIKAFLADEKAFESFNQFLTPERKALDPNCTGAACVYPGAAELKSSAQHWLDFWSSLPASQRDRLALAMAQIMKGTLEQEDSIADDRGQRLASLAIESILRSSSVYKQLYEALDVALETPLSSYEPFIQGLSRIKDNPIYLDAFEEKIGSSQLQDLVLEFLWKGGQPMSCSTAFAGVSSGVDPSARTELLKTLLNTSSACGGKAPVLVMLSQYLGSECSDISCSVNLFAEPKEADIKPTLNYAFSKISAELLADSFTLYRLGAARSEVSPTLWAELKAEANNRPFTNVQDIQTFEREMQLRHPKVLSMDWLELSLNKSIVQLAEVEQSFKSLYPDRNPVELWFTSKHTKPYSEADVNLSRVIFGLYPNGASEQVLAKMFSLDDLEADWKTSHSKSQINRRDLAQLLAPLRSMAAFYRNPLASFKPEAEKIILPWVGSNKNLVTFHKNGQKENAGDLLRTSLLFDESASGLSLLSRYREQVALATASVPAEEAGELRRWLLDEWLKTRVLKATTADVRSADLPTELFDRTTLSPLEARTLILFLGTQFVQELSDFPEGSTISSSPDTNANPRNESARAFNGPSAVGGIERPWTSFWLFQNATLSPSLTSFASMRSAIAQSVTGVRESFMDKANKPTLISQGLLDIADADALSDHEKLLLQLHLFSPLLENRGKQYFAPSVGFDRYCPKKTGQEFSASTCPFTFESVESYTQFLQARFTKAYCGVLPDNTAQLKIVLSALAVSESAEVIKSLCSAHKTSLSGNEGYVQAGLLDALALGKNPRLKDSVKSLPSALRWLKSSARQDNKEQLKAYLSFTPVIDGLTASKMQQRMGNYQAFFSKQPGAISVWLLYLSKDLGLNEVALALKKLGRQPIAGSEKPIQDFLNLIAIQYEAAKAQNLSTLEYAFTLITEISKNPSARETALRILDKPYDPYAGVLIGFTLPQAIKAGILPEFNWTTYRPLRLLLQNQNLDLLQGLAQIYDRDALSWLDHWLKLTAHFESMSKLSGDVRPLLNWIRSFAYSRGPESNQQITELAALRDWSAPISSLTRLYRLLRVSLPDLSNEWHDAFYFQSEALCRTLVDTLPRLLSLKDRFELSGGDRNLMPEAFLGLIQGPLKHDASELSLWLQDERMGFRSPSYWGAALRDPLFRQQLDLSLAGFDQTTREDWRRLRVEWDTLGPNASHLIGYTANNVILRKPDARYQKDALTSLARVTADEVKWQNLGLVLDAWLADESVLKQWQSEYKSNERGL